MDFLILLTSFIWNVILFPKKDNKNVRPNQNESGSCSSRCHGDFIVLGDLNNDFQEQCGDPLLNGAYDDGPDW